MTLFKKSNEERIARLIKRLRNREQSAISDIQGDILELREEEIELQVRLRDIKELYTSYLKLIQDHLEEWNELGDVLDANADILSSDT